MNRIVIYWICGLAITGLIAGGCAPFRMPINNEHNTASTTEPQQLSFYAAGNEGSQTEQLWVIERSAKISNAVPTLPPTGGLKAVVYGHKLPMPLQHMDVNATVHGFISTVDFNLVFVFCFV